MIGWPTTRQARDSVVLGSRRLGLADALVLGQQHGMDVGQNSSGRDGDLTKKLVKLLVVADGQLDVAGDDASLLVVPGGVACQLKHLSSQVFKHGGQVDGGACSDTGGELALLEEAADTGHGELKAGLRRPISNLSKPHTAHPRGRIGS